MSNPVTVPGASVMSDEVVNKHLNARHKSDLGLKADMHHSPLDSPVVMRAMRAFHRRIHDLATPDMYDHEHVDNN